MAGNTLVAAIVGLLLIGGGIAAVAAQQGIHPWGHGGAQHQHQAGHEGMGPGAMRHGMGAMGHDRDHDSDHDRDHDSDDMGPRGCPCGQWNLTVVNGTVLAGGDGYLVIATGDGNVTVKLLKTYVDNETGYLVSGWWLSSNIESGTEISVVIPVLPGQGHASPPALAIYYDGRELVRPGGLGPNYLAEK